MIGKQLRVVGLLALLGLGGGMPLLAKPGGPQTPVRTPSSHPGAAMPLAPAGSIPAGLPRNFWLGVSNQPTDLSWMTGSGAAWDARYQYLAGGVNTGQGWATWNTPAGQFATYYMDASAGAGYLPVFTYYQLLQSNPASGNDEASKDFNNLNTPATMAAYYADFQLLLSKAAAFGRPVLVHVEPDFWGYMEQRVSGGSNSAATIPAAVASSGYTAVAGYPNTVQGFAQALLHLRDATAPNVILAIHASAWGTGRDIGLDPDPTLDATAVGQSTGQFLLTAGITGNPAGTSSWDLVFGDPSDRDAAYYQIVIGDGGAHWWDLTNTTLPNYDRYRTYIAALNQTTVRRIVLWQIPIGNTAMRSCNNTAGHYQDNRVQGFLGNGAPSLPAWINAGLIGLLWGAGQGDQTQPTDAQGDGITNPAPINGNSGVATVADDDGGYLRTQAAAYYSRGPLPLPNGACGVFADVPASYWAYPYINALACRNIVAGYADGTFRPDTTTTRAQFAKMLVLGLGWSPISPPTPSFADVPPSFWGYTFVETAKAHGAISGYSDGTFRPYSNITRAQLSKMIVTAKSWTLLNPATPSFADVPPAHWAYAFVETAKAKGVVAGYGDGTFRPNNTATRAQLAKMLATALAAP
ncbi:MAG TPA: S-layer homology domain-containing protein [Chloroflexia bacterium]|nr:S-layer homology domain-containing protein [Chloroflexia bacterium]